MLKPKVATAWTPPDGECDAVETLGALKQTGGRVHVRPRDESRALSPDAAEKQAWLKSAPVEKTALPLLLCAIALPVRNPLTSATVAAAPSSCPTGRQLPAMWVPRTVSRPNERVILPEVLASGGGDGGETIANDSDGLVGNGSGGQQRQ